MLKTASSRSLAIMVCVTTLACLAYFFGASSGMPPALLAPVGLVAVGAMVYACVPWWRSVDEAVREAHKSAWFWGGIGACVPLIPALILLSQNQQLLETLSEGDHPYKLFAAGVLVTLLVQLAGYVIAWAAWWMQRR